jgi:hypothetical protein
MTLIEAKPDFKKGGMLGTVLLGRPSRSSDPTHGQMLVAGISTKQVRLQLYPFTTISHTVGMGYKPL